MDKRSIDQLLTDAGGRPLSSAQGVNEDVSALVAETRAAAARTLKATHRRRLFLVPAIGLAGLALTAGAYAYVTSLDADVTLPIAYTTDTGNEFRCTVWIEAGTAEIREYLRAQDWSGIGQRIYDRALQESPGSAEDDVWHWNVAATELTVDEIPTELLPKDALIAVSDSDCSGELH